MRFLPAIALCAIILPATAAPLRCGVISEPLDWNKTDLHGSLAGLGAEICRAIAVARDEQLEISSYTSEEAGLQAIKAGKADIVAGITPGAGSGQREGVRFSIPFFYDAQGFMVHDHEGVSTAADIAGHKLCYIEDTDNDPIASSYLAARNIRYVAFGFQEEGEMDAAIMDRHCQVVTADITKLAEARATFRDHAHYTMLPDLLTLSPVTVAVDARDIRLAGLVDTTLSVLLQAEFLGITQSGIAAQKRSPDPRVQRLLGDDFATGAAFALPHDWSRRVIAAVGSYGEIYNRTVGPGTQLDLPRGLNALWNQGGLMAPLPLQ